MALRVEDIDLAADRELVERWQAGEHEAFDDLYRRYFGRLRSYCQRRVGDHDTAEEIAQDAFVKALQALPRFGGERRFYPWVTVIAARLCVDHHRRLARVRPTEDVDAGTVDGDHGARLAFLADVDNLDRALQRLGPRHVEVLELREREGMSYAQIADHLSVPQSTVETLLYRARKALRREFMAVSGEGRLASIPLLGAVLRRTATARNRLGEALPSLSQLTGPVAASAMAVVMTAPPFSGGGVAAPVTAATTQVMTTTMEPISTSIDRSAPERLATDSDAAGPADTTDHGPGALGIEVQTMSSREADANEDDMPVNLDLGPFGFGVDPHATLETISDPREDS